MKFIIANTLCTYVTCRVVMLKCVHLHGSVLSDNTSSTINRQPALMIYRGKISLM